MRGLGGRDREAAAGRFIVKGLERGRLEAGKGPNALQTHERSVSDGVYRRTCREMSRHEAGVHAARRSGVGIVGGTRLWT